MEEAYLKECIDKRMSINDIAIDSSKSKGSIRHWMNKYKLKTLNKHGGLINTRQCKCGESRVEEFYGHRKTTCKSCHNKITTKNGKDNKEFGVKLLGGKCLHCGFNENIVALQFHHIDPKIKDKDFAGIRGWSKLRIENELKNCILLCANCHVIEHDRLHLL